MIRWYTSFRNALFKHAGGHNSGYVAIIIGGQHNTGTFCTIMAITHISGTLAGSTVPVTIVASTTLFKILLGHLEKLWMLEVSSHTLYR